MRLRPLVFGEVLFDVFPDGRSVLGGAPFNVTWHLTGFGLNPLIISRVGNDAAGREVLDDMRLWGMDTAGVQTDGAYPTGQVTVQFEQDEPTFSIPPDQAYDHLDSTIVESVVEGVRPALLYHGTLALREDPSWKALAHLIERVDVPIFYDVNLRDPWWQEDRVRWSLEHADWIKMNRSELERLVSDPLTSSGDVVDAIGHLSVKDSANVVITEGGNTVTGRIGGQIERQSVQPIDGIVDTVGAGDAFSAVLVMGIIRRWPSRALLERATQFAGDVCAVRGATVHDAELYGRQFEKWERP